MTQSRPARQGHRPRREPKMSRPKLGPPGIYDMGTVDEVDMLHIARQQGVAKLPAYRLEKGHLGDWFLHYEFPRVRFRVGPYRDPTEDAPLGAWRLQHYWDRAAQRDLEEATYQNILRRALRRLR